MDKNNILDMHKKQEELIDIQGVYEFWKHWAHTLNKKDIEVKAADFDYTLFSRDEQLEKEAGLQQNRGDSGPKYIFKEIGMMKFLETYYKDKTIPKDIIKGMNPQHDIVLTAGIYEFQIAKVRLCKQLDDFKALITVNGKDKIATLLRYILFDLQYLPSKVTIYEDRPEYFVEYKDLIEDVLGCPLEIIFVRMKGADAYEKMEEI